MDRCMTALFILAGMFLPWQAMAQDDSTAQQGEVAVQEKVETLKGQVDGLNESFLETKSTVDKLAKIKISGYVQAQFRLAPDTSGQLDSNTANKYSIGDFAGGALPNATQSVLQVRRARVKFAYETAHNQMVVQMDYLPGSISLKDAYLRFSEPWLKSLGLKMGVFDRPFGFEISYSSSNRESPERSRVFQTLFPGERDLGVSLEYLPAEILPAWAQYFTVKVGAFAGNGIAIENDDNRDIIGRLGYSIPLKDLNLAIDGGFSGYAGNVRNYNDTLRLVENGAYVTQTGSKRANIERQYQGADLQLYYGDIPVLGGLTLRGEYLRGAQPSTSSSSSGSPKSDVISSNKIYLRDFNGYYVYGVQNIDPLKSQLVIKYDSYDPNTELAGTAITAAGDMTVNTLGLGLMYHWDENVKFVAYYDKVENELIGGSSVYTKDINDDVFTFRVQYKF